MTFSQNISKKSFLYLVIMTIIFSYNGLMAQEISGVVTDVSTDEPLYMVSVYLNKTTLGCATDEQGFYSIKNIPPGKYEMIVSLIGYTYVKKTITVGPISKNIHNFDLEPEPLQAPSIKIEGRRPRNWEKNLGNFTKSFLGNTPNARKCKIHYTEYLSFKYDEINHILTASTDHPLEIINQGLGYKITADLIDFKYFALSSDTQYEYNAQFQSLEPKNEKEKKQWQERRSSAYNGSKYHFMRSLLADSLEENDFEIYSTFTMVIGDDPSKKQITADDILSSDNMLSFPGYLEIIYKGEILPKDYKKYLKKRGVEQPAYYQHSWLKINNISSILVNENGSTYAPRSCLTVYGYWFWERIADRLPLDYNPEDQ